MEAYHDKEWGTPLHDDRGLFELLTLEGAQAGLSWMTILRRRDGYRRAFANFDPARVAAFGEPESQRLLANPEIIRNRQKIESTIANARRILEVQQEYGSFDNFVWSFVGGKPLDHRFRSSADMPAQTPESVALSRALKKRGFGFVGPTICYAFMQAAGLVNDHLVSCPARIRIDAEAATTTRSQAESGSTGASD
jgi:DNA-3-methyladenine glycosylase I